MHAKDAIKTALTSTKDTLAWYMSDLSDADSEQFLLGQLPGAAYPKLPAGWADQHSKTAAAMDPSKGFATKAEYLTQFNKAREATLAALAQMSDADWINRPKETWRSLPRPWGPCSCSSPITR